MDQLIQYDWALFKIVNQGWSNAFFDFLMPWLRNSNLWVPFYLFVILFVLLNGKKNAWYWILGCALTVVLSNFISSNLIKENIMRIRPCNHPALAQGIHILVGYKPQSSSFTSSHATNHMALAAYIYFTLRSFFKPWLALIFIWGLSIGFAQIYVGVHFPIDVFVGSILGTAIGYCASKVANRYFCISLH